MQIQIQIHKNNAREITNIDIPQSWNDLVTRDNKKAIACFALIQHNSELESRKLALLAVLTDLPIAYFTCELLSHVIAHYKSQEKPLRDAYPHYLTVMSELLDCTNFLFASDSNSIAATLTVCPLSCFNVYDSVTDTFTTLYAPQNELDGIAFGELILIFEYYQRAIDDNTDAALNELLALVYREHDAEKVIKKRQDCRVAVLENEHLISERVPLCASLAPIVRQFLLYWIGCCLAQKAKKYPSLFDQKQDNSNNTNNTNSFGWAGVLFALANNVNSIEETAKRDADNVLIYLSWCESVRQEREAAHAEYKKRQRLAND